MAKQSYKVPASLDSSFFDVELAFQSDDGVGLRPMPLKTVLAIVVSGLVCFWAASSTFVKAGGPLLIIAFVAVWAMVTFMLVKPDGTGGIRAQWVPVALEYMSKANRRVSCRKADRANDFRGLCNISDIDYERGLIEFCDGTYGYLYSIVGAGSVLLFDEDRDAIINRADTFFRKMKCGYELIFITVKEPQHVERQVEAMDRRIARLTAAGSDPELIQLVREERRTLAEGVGREFRSIHQYMIVKAENPEMLEVGKNMFVSECESSTLMFKRASALFGEDMDAVFASLYKGKETV